jgi:hypothetical protein
MKKKIIMIMRIIQSKKKKIIIIKKIKIKKLIIIMKNKIKVILDAIFSWTRLLYKYKEPY